MVPTLPVPHSLIIENVEALARIEADLAELKARVG
jgi:hypothetical protein